MAHALESVTVPVRAETLAFVRRVVETGAYNSAGDIVQEALDAWTADYASDDQENVARLKRLWDEAVADDSSGTPADVVFADLRRKLRAMHAHADAA